MITPSQLAITDRGGCLLELLADARRGGRRLMQLISFSLLLDELSKSSRAASRG